jgi:hypothetical protein
VDSEEVSCFGSFWRASSDTFQCCTHPSGRIRSQKQLISATICKRLQELGKRWQKVKPLCIRCNSESAGPQSAKAMGAHIWQHFEMCARLEHRCTLGLRPKKQFLMVLKFFSLLPQTSWKTWDLLEASKFLWLQTRGMFPNICIPALLCLHSNN